MGFVSGMNLLIIIGIDLFIFILALCWLLIASRKRLLEESNATWMQMFKQIGARQYVVFAFESSVVCVHVLFSIYVLHTDIGNVLAWISIPFWIAGCVTNCFRYKWYKKLIIYQDGDKVRSIDVAMVGMLALALEDFPLLLIAFLIGEDDAQFGFDNFAVIICLAVSFAAIAIKIGLLFGACCCCAQSKADVSARNRTKSDKDVQMSNVHFQKSLNKVLSLTDNDEETEYLSSDGARNSTANLTLPSKPTHIVQATPSYSVAYVE